MHRLCEAAIMHLFPWCEGFAPLGHYLCMQRSTKVWSADTEQVGITQSCFKDRAGPTIEIISYSKQSPCAVLIK